MRASQMFTKFCLYIAINLAPSRNEFDVSPIALFHQYMRLSYTKYDNRILIRLLD